MCMLEFCAELDQSLISYHTVVLVVMWVQDRGLTTLLDAPLRILPLELVDQLSYHPNPALSWLTKHVPNL